MAKGRNSKKVRNKRFNINDTSSVHNKKIGKNEQIYAGKKYVSKFAIDSEYIPNFTKSKKVKAEIFKNLLNEIQFTQMFNFSGDPKTGKQKIIPIPRLTTAQTDKLTDKSPIYRMRATNTTNIQTQNYTPTVDKIRKDLEAFTGHKLNHATIIMYRDGNDSLAFHKDKLLDIEDKSTIYSVSYGAARPILFHSTKSGKQQRVSLMLQPGSVLAIGPKTNQYFEHSIPKLNQAGDVGPRISLSFRTSSTFIKEDKYEYKSAKKEDIDDVKAENLEPKEIKNTTDLMQNIKYRESGDFKITGKGELYQQRDYPFQENHNEVENYTDTVLKTMVDGQKAADKWIQNLKDILATENNTNVGTFTDL